jgi:hypothetical protein
MIEADPNKKPNQSWTVEQLAIYAKGKMAASVQAKEAPAASSGDPIPSAHRFPQKNQNVHMLLSTGRSRISS